MLNKQGLQPTVKQLLNKQGLQPTVKQMLNKTEGAHHSKIADDRNCCHEQSFPGLYRCFWDPSSEESCMDTYTYLEFH